jgi:hypothetical protein
LRLLAALFALLAASVIGAALAAERAAGPEVIIEKPGKCVEPTDFMRRNHMKLLLHQRDITVHEGIVSQRYSLAGCIDCHASSKTGSVLGEKGFCESCHAYAGVRPDCFECHSPRARTRTAGDRR